MPGAAGAVDVRDRHTGRAKRLLQSTKWRAVLERACEELVAAAGPGSVLSSACPAAIMDALNSWWGELDQIQVGRGVLWHAVAYLCWKVMSFCLHPWGAGA